MKRYLIDMDEGQIKLQSLRVDLGFHGGEYTNSDGGDSDGGEYTNSDFALFSDFLNAQRESLRKIEVINGHFVSRESSPLAAFNSGAVFTSLVVLRLQINQRCGHLQSRTSFESSHFWSQFPQTVPNLEDLSLDALGCGKACFSIDERPRYPSLVKGVCIELRPSLAFLRHLPRLQSLRLVNAYLHNVSSFELGIVLRDCQMLQHVSIDQSSKDLTGESRFAYMNRPLSLKSLSLNNLALIGSIKDICENSHHIRDISLNFSERPTPKEWLSFCASLVNHCPKLRRLKLTDSGDFVTLQSGQCLVNMRCLEEMPVVTQFPRNRPCDSLRLFCSGIPASLLILKLDAAQYRFTPHLTRLISAKCPGIKELVLPNCGSAVGTLGSLCLPNLRDFSISESYVGINEVITFAAKSRDSLCRYSATRCSGRGMSDSALHHLFSECSRLTQLEVSETKPIGGLRTDRRKLVEYMTSISRDQTRSGAYPMDFYSDPIRLDCCEYCSECYDTSCTLCGRLLCDDCANIDDLRDEDGDSNISCFCEACGILACRVCLEDGDGTMCSSCYDQEQQLQDSSEGEEWSDVEEWSDEEGHQGKEDRDSGESSVKAHRPEEDQPPM